MDEPEKHLCERIRGGDKDAFEYVFKTYYGQLCGYARQIVLDPDASEEIIQELFFQLWQKKESLQVNTSLKSYLFRAVHNSCLNHIKHHKIRDAYSQNFKLENIDNSVSDSQNLEVKELQMRITKAIELLPPERKKVFMMIRFEERKYKEVADILGISVKTVENQMGKAMQFLREALKDLIPLLLLFILHSMKSFFS
ncbi:MAG: RNA polymerase sigma-70 factor [Bacteroidota bacterium]